MVTLTAVTSISLKISCRITLWAPAPQEMRRELVTYDDFVYFLGCEYRK